MDLVQAGQDRLALGEVKRGDDLAIFQPLIDAELLADVRCRLRTVNFSSNFSLSSRCHWKVRLAGHTTRTRSAKPRSFSSRSSRPAMMVLPAPASSASRKRTRASLQQIVVNRFELMRQRIDARDRKAEIWIELVGDAEHVGLQAEPEQFTVASVRRSGVLTPQRRDLLTCQRHAAEDLALDTDQAELPAIGADGVERNHPHRFAEQRTS